MHILFLTDNFPPEVNAPASRTFEHASEWVKSGHRVTVITCAPNFPTGKVFPGYRNRLWQTEHVDGIRVIRVFTIISANEGFLVRTIDYLSFMVAAVLASPFVRGVDVVVGTSPQFFTACAAWAVGALKRRPFVFELRDLWPESIKAVGAMRQSPALDLLERIELFLYRRAAAIVSVTHSFKRTLAARRIDPAKIAVVTNGVDLERFAPRPKDAQLAASLGLDGAFVAGYIGTHGLAHALDTVLDAAKLLAGEPRIRILLLGDGAEKTRLKRRAAAERIGNVLFVDTVPKSEVARYWSLLDVSIIHLKRDALFRSVIPSKLFESMAMGIPVVLGVEGESAEILTRHEAGLAIEPENAEALADAILRLRRDSDEFSRFRENGMSAARRYDRKALALTMLEVLERVGNRATRSRWTRGPEAG